MTVHIPAALREFADGRGEVQLDVPSATLYAVLAALGELYPGVRDRVLTEQGQLRPHINIFLGDENVRYTGGLATPVPADAVLSILPAVSGGLASLQNHCSARLS